MFGKIACRKWMGGENRPITFKSEIWDTIFMCNSKWYSLWTFLKPETILFHLKSSFQLYQSEILTYPKKDFGSVYFILNYLYYIQDILYSEAQWCLPADNNISIVKFFRLVCRKMCRLNTYCSENNSKGETNRQTTIIISKTLI